MGIRYAAPRPTANIVFLSLPATPTLCIPTGVGIVPRMSPLGLTTRMPPAAIRLHVEGDDVIAVLVRRPAKGDRGWNMQTPAMKREL